MLKKQNEATNILVSSLTKPLEEMPRKQHRSIIRSEDFHSQSFFFDARFLESSFTSSKNNCKVFEGT